MKIIYIHGIKILHAVIEIFLLQALSNIKDLDTVCYFYCKKLNILICATNYYERRKKLIPIG